ncbi:MAG: VOC family protein [Chloroflexi bacterium]|nr:VOC family protein [Chloroflexota bacterium]
MDHIALSCSDVAQGAALLGEVGYHVRFVERDLFNHPAKRPFLRRYAATHSVAYCGLEGAISIELTRHEAPLGQGVSPYQVLLAGAPDDVSPWQESLPPSWASVWRRAIGCGEPVAARWHPFSAQLWYDAQSHVAPSGSVQALLLPVANRAASEAFWVSGLGCRVVGRSTEEDAWGWVRLSFSGPVTSWSVEVVLAEVDRRGGLPHLDDPGFPCLAVISNRLARDMETALRAGAREASEEFPLEVGGKTLKIVLVRGPDGELVEMLGF